MKRLFVVVVLGVVAGACFAVGMRAAQSLLPPERIEIRIRMSDASERFA